MNEKNLKKIIFLLRTGRNRFFFPKLAACPHLLTLWLNRIVWRSYLAEWGFKILKTVGEIGDSCPLCIPVFVSPLWRYRARGRVGRPVRFGQGVVQQYIFIHGGGKWRSSVRNKVRTPPGGRGKSPTVQHLFRHDYETDDRWTWSRQCGWNRLWVLDTRNGVYARSSPDFWERQKT